MGFGDDGEVTRLEMGEEGAERVAFYFTDVFSDPGYRWGPERLVFGDLSAGPVEDAR